MACRVNSRVLYRSRAEATCTGVAQSLKTLRVSGHTKWVKSGILRIYPYALLGESLGSVWDATLGVSLSQGGVPPSFSLMYGVSKLSSLLLVLLPYHLFVIA